MMRYQILPVCKTLQTIPCINVYVPQATKEVLETVRARRLVSIFSLSDYSVSESVEPMRLRGFFSLPHM